ncbi:hypothetical protein HanRHA438_Chr09g0416241 [Helianthus annuus]|nr:hypothetical protein HanRHA438_Chr09g0416241 [Helianthus annuus]
MTDAYIPKKKDRIGNTFGFIRFAGVRDVHALGENLGSVKINKVRVSVNLAKFEKEKYFGTNEPKGRFIDNDKVRNYHQKTAEATKANIPPVKTVNAERTVHHNHNQKQNNAWFPKNTTGQAKKNATPENTRPNIETGIRELKVPEDTLKIHLQESENSKRWRRSSIIGEVKNPYNLKDIQTLLEIDALSGFTTKYLGGLRMLLVFKSATEAEDFVKLKKEQWSTWFSSLCRWEGQHMSFQ